MNARMVNLEKAERVRVARAETRRKIHSMGRAAGEAEAARILGSPGEVWQGAKLEYVLSMPRQRGKTTAAKMCRRIGVDPSARLSEVPARYRMALVVLLSPDTFIDLAVAA